MALIKLNIVSAVKDKDGNITEDGYYTDADGNKVETVITVGSGKTVKRYDRSKMTAEELMGKQSTKGHTAARKICVLITQIDKRVKNLLQNPDMKLSSDERVVLANFITGTANSATDKLEGVTEAEASLPFGDDEV